ncbi:MAG: acetolactate synthase small subunit [Actinomycetota bacterium]
MSTHPAQLHIISALVENRPGVLARIALLFSRRGFNIFSLAVAPTDDVATSRVTIVVDADSAPIEQITKQLHKLINVIKINELPPHESIERELMLATVGVLPERRSELLALADLFAGQVVDVGHDRITLMVADHPERLDAFEDLIRPYGIVELQRTGRVALPMLEREAPTTTRLRVAN